MKSNSKLRYHAARLLGICGLVLGSITVAQAVITVTNLNDSGPGSLRQAIADAAPGDTIGFAVTGTITLTSGELVITNNLTISGPGATNLTVSGNNASRVLLITNGVVSISELTIANGHLPSPFGPASIANLGAGIYNSATLTISNCSVIANTNATPSPNYGGGILNWYGALTVVKSDVSNNRAYYFAGIADIHGTMTVASCLFRSNYGEAAVGGLGTQNGRIHIMNSAVVNNRGLEVGGVLNQGGFLTLTNTTVSGNTLGCGFAGGGGTNVIINSTICSNSTPYSGGGINIASGGGQVNIANSIVAGNTKPDISVALSGAELVSLDFNLIGNTNGATITGVTTHNIYGKDPLLGPLADNGGPTMTHALLPGSPAIDQGNSGGLATDQRGQPRIYNFPAYIDAADGSDIGAYELSERAQTNWVVSGSSSNLVFIVNSTNDVDDGVPGIAHCSLREAINAANANADTNTIDFAAEVPGVHTGVTGTITLTNGELTITKSVNINGPGAVNLTVSGNDSNRVFYLAAVPAATISGLTVANGNTGNDGGGIYSDSSALTIVNCRVVGNKARVTGGGLVNSFGVLTLINSTIYSNTANNSGGGINSQGGTLRLICSALLSNRSVSGSGGGVVNGSGGTAAFTNSTISRNVAFDGGGISSGNTSTTLIYSCTICSNSAHSGGGGIDMGALVRIGNTILVGNVSDFDGHDFAATLTSDDYNLIQNTNGGTITGTTIHNIYNQDPKLGPLADLGGPTPTHALRFDSPAIDAGNSSGLATDQRGLLRPIDDPNIANVAGGDGSDIGAYETDPNLRLTAIAKSGNDILLNFTTVFGRNYQVNSENNLGDSWAMVTNNVAGSGGVMQAVDAGGANQPQRFYRAAQLP